MKLSILLLCAALLFSMTACGSNSVSVAELSADVIQADVQEYIATFIDANATITSFSETENSISATETQVTCSVGYAGDQSGNGVFVLDYALEGSNWVLQSCNVNLEDTAETVAAEQPAQGSQSESVQDAAEAVENPQPEEADAQSQQAIAEDTGMQTDDSEAGSLTDADLDIPAYLLTYQAPSGLGDDLTKPIIQIDNCIYSIPAPLSLFTDNGWSIKDTEQELVLEPDKMEAIILTKENGENLRIAVKNYDTSPEPLAYCAVYQVEIWNTDHCAVKMPQNITFDSTMDYVKSVVPDAYYEVGDSMKFDDDAGFNDFTAANGSETLTAIKVNRNKWWYN